MDVYASLRYLRMSPRKVRLVIDAIRGLGVLDAETRLTFMKQGAARPVLKLLRSAMANAEHNFHVSKDQLAIKTITADGGPTLKRFTPRAFGRAAPIRKRTTHIELILAPKAEVKPSKKAKKLIAKKTSPKKSSPKNVETSKNA